jgi:8-oxo-dGTP diphosphatase
VTDYVRAAGGVLHRTGAGGDEVLLIRRSRYGDWTFPKGKCEPGEADEDCAVREVEEETGLRCALDRELPSTAYVDSKGRPKRVRYWVMNVIGGEARPAPPEVDEVRWVAVVEAEELLSYTHDRALLGALLS